MHKDYIEIYAFTRIVCYNILNSMNHCIRYLSNVVYDMGANIMDVIQREILFNRIRSWILDAGNIIRENMYDPLTIDTKSNPKDLVTELDRQVEFFFATKIKEHYPDHLLLSEEGYGDHLSHFDGTIWVIDPIDGTMNFVNQKQNFAISIGVYADGIGEIGFIYDVMRNNLYSAMRDNGAYKNNVRLQPLQEKLTLKESVLCMSHRWFMPNRFVDEEVMHNLSKEVRGLRSYGSAAIELAYVAEGAAEAYISMGLEPWDVAAGRVILSEVGGKLTDMDGKEIPMLSRSTIIACNPSIQSKLLHEYFKKGKKVT